MKSSIHHIHATISVKLTADENILQPVCLARFTALLYCHYLQHFPHILADVLAGKVAGQRHRLQEVIKMNFSPYHSKTFITLFTYVL
jgi:hypothetical protein